MYLLRRSDGEAIGEYAFWVVEGSDDWHPIDGSEPPEPTTYEIVYCRPIVVGTTILGRRLDCAACDATGDDPLGELPQCPVCDGTGLEQ